ncbi:phospholipase D-like domain-containing protein [Pandoraea sp. NPDC090278]|uniref:phospholipase D-like domain-containing protein n=1 Tax=Pandoraea sp. NPDC090278 TaxID=3364391 RepID=UPI00383B5660
MAKFLNTSATNYFLEELIKGAVDRVILISPFLKLNDRIKELLADKNRLKIDVRLVYGKSELQPPEIEWLKGLTYVRTSYCKNLHAKCYMSEELCVVTSLNLSEFGQINNYEMGVLVRRSEDTDLYRDVYEEAQRIIRIGEEVRIRDAMDLAYLTGQRPADTLRFDEKNIRDGLLCIQQGTTGMRIRISIRGEVWGSSRTNSFASQAASDDHVGVRL